MIRGSCREGLRSRVTSGAMASQPTKDSISTEAALPSADQPCGANGVQFAVCAAGAEPMTATAIITTSRATSTSWAVVVARAPPRVSAITTASSTAAAPSLSARPPPNGAAT